MVIVTGLSCAAMALRKGVLSVLALVGSASAGSVPKDSFYALTAKNIDGKEIPFKALEGMKEVFVTNVASA